MKVLVALVALVALVTVGFAWFGRFEPAAQNLSEGASDLNRNGNTVAAGNHYEIPPQQYPPPANAPLRAPLVYSDRNQDKHPSMPLNEGATAVDARPNCATVNEKLAANFSYTTDELTYLDARMQSNNINRDACYAVARTLRDSSAIFDLTTSKATHFGRGAGPPYPPRGGFNIIETILSAHICSGDAPFTDDLVVRFELSAIGPDDHVRIFVGDGWLSDGTIVTRIPASEFAYLSEILVGHQRTMAQGMPRARFDKMIAEDFRQFLGPERYEIASSAPSQAVANNNALCAPMR